MKKSKLSITLVTGFIAAMALSACSNVSASKKAVVTFTPYGENNERYELITDAMYNAYRDTSGGISKFYDKILEVLIRYQFKENNFSKGELNYAEIEKWADNQVKEQKQKAKDNAKSNNTSYDKEWKSILESNSVDDANGLKEKFIYDKEKEVIKNWFADDETKAKGLKEEFLGIKADGTAVASDVPSAMPYHIRHILVKVEEASDANEKFYKGTVTEAQAKLLYNTVTTLAKGEYSFSQVAEQYSEDTSAKSGGDVGIMTNTATSGSLGMVNEFQLGLYAYDNLYDLAHAGDGTDAHPADPAAAVIRKGLGFDSVLGKHKNAANEIVEEKVADHLPAGVVEVPYEVFVKMGLYADVTTDKQGNKLAGGSASLYPRNIIWNKYLNLHNVFVIKNAKRAGTAYDGDGNPTAYAAGKAEFAALASGTKFDANLPRFNDKDYLVDENGNVIIGVRSQYGIHLMVIEESLYDYANLATYYDTKLPSDTTWDKNARSYVNYIESAALEDYKKRADDIKSKVTSFDPTYDYRLYSYLTDPSNSDGVTIHFDGAAKGLDTKLNAYIASLKEDNTYKQADGLKQVWRTYTELLEVQTSNREAEYTTKNPATGDDSPTLTRLVPEKIADDFYKLYSSPAAGLDATYLKFAEEGEYHYYA